MKPGNLTELINALTDLANTAIPVLVALAFLLFLWGIVDWIFNVADTEKHKKGRNRMIWGIIALFVITSLWGIINIAHDTFFDDTRSNGSISSQTLSRQDNSSGASILLPRTSGSFLDRVLPWRSDNHSGGGTLE